ncbi:hypothetical protein P9265_15430 [Schinkia azotoformans]|nr:hypothetical protein [Schinkia azotoformans]
MKKFEEMTGNEQLQYILDLFDSCDIEENEELIIPSSPKVLINS